jgi:hypothetical protein
MLVASFGKSCSPSRSRIRPSPPTGFSEAPMSEFDHGPSAQLAQRFDRVPDPPVKSDFWFDWGPVFYRGRLDGSARVLYAATIPERGPHSPATSPAQYLAGGGGVAHREAQSKRRPAGRRRAPARNRDLRPSGPLPLKHRGGRCRSAQGGKAGSEAYPRSPQDSPAMNRTHEVRVRLTSRFSSDIARAVSREEGGSATRRPGARASRPAHPAPDRPRARAERR